MMKIIIMCIAIFQLVAKELPKWVINIPTPDKKGIYFVGCSKWYVTNDTRMLSLAQKDALNNGYSQISDYFGVNIKSNLNIKQSTYNNNQTKSININISTKTNQLIFDIKPYKKFIEYSDDGENFRIYYLFLLTPDIKNKIKKEMKKDEKEFKNLEKQILIAINNKEFYKAENLINIAKGKRSSYIDDTLKNLEQRLNNLINSQLIAKISINKTTFLPDENIQFYVTLNKNGYLYLFYETGEDVEMLYPNLYQLNPYIKKNIPVVFDEDSDVYVTAYEEDLNKKVKLIAIASKKVLDIQSFAIDRDEGVYIYNKNGKYKDIIKECLKNNICTKSVVELKVSKNITKPIILSIKASKSIKETLLKYLKSNGIVSKKSNQIIRFTITKKSKYSKLLDMKITTYIIDAKAYKKNKLLKEIYNECSEDDLKDIVYNTYIDLSKLF